jgi:hypothetical protein
MANIKELFPMTHSSQDSFRLQQLLIHCANTSIPQACKVGTELGTRVILWGCLFYNEKNQSS